MFSKYLLVFICSMAVDILPVPLPPAFTVMIILQVVYHLDVWTTIIIGVAGSIFGRLMLTLYIPKVSARIFDGKKNSDIQFLGSKLRQKGWKGQAFVLLYSLMPLPTTPLFLGAGIARLHPLYIIPAFTVGKFISDAIAVLTGDYAVRNVHDVMQGVMSWKSVTGLVLGLLMVSALLFIDWHVLLRERKLSFRFNIWAATNRA